MRAHFCPAVIRFNHCGRLTHAQHCLVSTTLNAELMQHVRGAPAKGQEGPCLASGSLETVLNAGLEHCAVL